MAKEFIGTCVDSFDSETGECLHSALPWSDVSALAVAEETRFQPISKNAFEKEVSIKLWDRALYAKDGAVFIAYDPEQDIHYFFI